MYGMHQQLFHVADERATDCHLGARHHVGHRRRAGVHRGRRLGLDLRRGGPLARRVRGLAPCRPRWGESSPCARITRNTRVRATRMSSRIRSRAWILRWPSPWNGERARSVRMAASNCASDSAGVGPRRAPGPHPALGAAHEPAARSAPSATVPTGSTPVVFFNEKRTDNEERSTQRNRPLNRIMASPAAGGASCGRGVVPAAARSGTPAPVQRPYWHHRREHLNRRVKTEAVEGAVEWYRSLLMVHMVFNGHSRKYGIWNDLWHRVSAMV